MDIIEDSERKTGSVRPASTEDAPTRETVRAVSVGAAGFEGVGEISGSPNAPSSSNSSKFLVSEIEDESENEAAAHLRPIMGSGAEMIPPEPAVPSDVGADESDDDDESEYSYEDEDDTHFGGFLMEQQQPPQPTASIDDSTAVAPARIEEEVVSEAPAEEEEQTRKKWREPSKAAVNMSLRAEREKTGGKRRLAADLYKIMMADTEEAGFSLQPKSEDSMDKWTIKLFKFDEDSCLHKDMLALGIDHIELEMSFPDQYPFEPPFVRVVRPRFKRQTGFVMNGALCMELLTSEGWNPVNDIESVIVSIRSLLVVGEGRLQAAIEMGEAKREAAIAAASNGDKDKKLEADPHPKKRRKSSDGDKAGRDEKVAASKTSIGQYSSSEAKAAYSHLSDYHQKKGWDSSGWWARKG